MVRKVTFIVRPTPALGALLSFAQSTRTHRSGLGDRLEREVLLALESAARTLDPVPELLRWLTRRGLARTSGYVHAASIAAETTVTFDLRAMVAAALAQGTRVDGRAYTDLYCIRSLVRSVREAELLSIDGVVLGRQADTTRALLRAIEGACRETALRDESVVPKLFARVTPGAAQPPTKPTPPAPAPQAKAPTAKRVAPPEPKPPAGSFGGSFGGLPDDATSPPVAPETPLSPRGLTLDAEFFLESARLTVWPCSAKVLTRSRRSVLIALHPDRAGEGSEARFRSALKGFEDLARVLSTTPPPAREAKPPPAPPPPSAVRPQPVSAIGQWPPPPPSITIAVSSAPVETSAPTAKRQSFKRSSKA
ncbi:MAG: hypothetical protein EPO40_29690 [Myxococcaceae bacterium]|nr:MAG: hypothetical protein EPO40_29690 [Myxococcaceae bacterium]